MDSTQRSRHFLVGLVVLAAILSAVSCGGGGSSVTPPAFKPFAFTSTPPQTAAESEEYTYTVSAPDPQGGTVSFSLETKPAGATLSGNIISWTPARDQSRKENSFTVLATTSQGATARQSFTIVPSGDIHGSRIDTYWNASGATQVPLDLSNEAFIGALVPDANGGLATIAGQGFADGTFIIRKVPAGFYWLRLSSVQMFWTDSNDFDGGSDYQGHPVSGPGFTLDANVTLTGLTPWDRLKHHLSGLVDTRQDEITFLGVPQPGPILIVPTTIPIENGATDFTGQLRASFRHPVNAADGESTYIFQLERPPLQWGQQDFASSAYTSRVVKASGPLSLSASAGGTLDFSASLSDSTLAAMRAAFKGAEFNQSIAGTAPGAEPFTFGASVFYTPITDRLAAPPERSFRFMSGFSLASVESRVPPTDFDFGDLTYANPLPDSWTPIYLAVQMAGITVFQSSNARVILVGTSGYMTKTAPTATAPFQLPMLNVQNPTINNHSLFDTPSLTEPVTLSWTEPAGLKPSYYTVAVVELIPTSDCSCPPLACLPPAECPPKFRLAAMLTTTKTSVTLPRGILTTGHLHNFTITAVADPATNALTAPLRGSLNRAFTDVVSYPIGVGASVASGNSRRSANSTTNAGSPPQQRFLLVDRDGTIREVTR